jgi:hypothetical protein
MLMLYASFPGNIVSYILLRLSNGSARSVDTHRSVFTIIKGGIDLELHIRPQVGQSLLRSVGTIH